MNSQTQQRHLLYMQLLLEELGVEPNSSYSICKMLIDKALESNLVPMKLKREAVVRAQGRTELKSASQSRPIRDTIICDMLESIAKREDGANKEALLINVIHLKSMQDENAIMISIDELRPKLSVHFSLRSELRAAQSDKDSSSAYSNQEEPESPAFGQTLKMHADEIKD